MKPYDAKLLLQAASDSTGLTDFGPEDFMEGLEVLVASLNANQSINDDRWQDAFDFLVRLLKNRLWFAKDLKEHPEILEEELVPPVVILPLPRTGSTKLQRMLDASSSFQPLLYWRMFMFARIPGLADGGAAVRLQETRDFEAWLYKTCPDYLKGHPIFADEPDEDQMLHRFTFRAPILTTMFYAPEATRWVAEADMTPTYAYLVMQLKYLQWQFHRGEAPRPWLLKSPPNVGYEPYLMKAFGRGMKVMAPHRDPVNIVCSIIRTSEYTSSVYSDIILKNKGLAHEKAKRMLDMLATSAVRNMQWRDENPDIKVLDLAYRDIEKHPIDVLRAVYAHLDLELTQEIENSVIAWEKDASRNKYAPNTYTAEEFGLTNDQIHEAFAPYMERFAAYI